MKEGYFMHRPLPLAVVTDPTGAGDTFAGGMMGYLASTGDASYENLKKSIIFLDPLSLHFAWKSSQSTD